MDKNQTGTRENKIANRKMRKAIILPVISLFVAAGLLFLSWWFATAPTSPPALTNLPEKNDLSQAEIDAFYATKIRPALANYADKNKDSVDRAVDRISRGIDAYRAGIPNFIEDVSSWGTRFGVIGRGSQDLWEEWFGDSANTTKVHDYVSGKFESHLFSDAELSQLVESSLRQFRDDLMANQNKLHTDIKLAWESSEYASHTSQELNFQVVVSKVNTYLKEYSVRMATDSVVVGVLSITGGLILEQAIEKLAKVIVVKVAIYLATSAATTTASSGGATGAGIATGGAAGSTVGPWGTVIGVAAGLVVGFIADWWMTDQFEKKLTTECEKMLTDVELQVLNGADDAPGLKQAFIESIHAIGEGEEHAIYASLKEMAK